MLAGLTVGPYYVDGPWTPYLRSVEEVGYFMAYWVILGVASSIGLGTGLHTFVLYLGPWIAKVTMAANECNAIPEMIPNKWSFKHFAPCPTNVETPLTFWDVLFSV